MQPAEQTKVVKVCIDKDLTPDEEQLASQTGVELGLVDELGLGDGTGPLELAASPVCGATAALLSVRFLGGETDRSRTPGRVATRTSGSSTQTSRFRFVDGGADRVVPRSRSRRTPAPGPSWAPATCCTGSTRMTPTMNYRLARRRKPTTRSTAGSCSTSSAMRSAASTNTSILRRAIPWDKEKAYAWYGQTNGWSRAEVDQQVFNRYSGLLTQFTQFDPTSIMEYPIPEDITIGNFSIGWNRQLSDMDKHFIGQLYPFPPK